MHHALERLKLVTLNITTIILPQFIILRKIYCQDSFDTKIINITTNIWSQFEFSKIVEIQLTPKLLQKSVKHQEYMNQESGIKMCRRACEQKVLK